MGDSWDGNEVDEDDSIELINLEESRIIDYEALLKSSDLEKVAEKIVEGTYGEVDFMKKDILDRFLDFVFFKVQTGYIDIPSMAFPTKRMIDTEFERKVMELINVHLYPEIVLRLLKFFSRNIHDPDSNLYIANLIESEDIIRSIYETFKLFKKDIFIADKNKRSLNVKRIQQFSSRSENSLSSPLDASAIFKYILEFFLVKMNVEDIYTIDDLLLSKLAE